MLREIPWFLAYTVGFALAGGLLLSGAFYWDVRAGLIGGAVAMGLGFLGFLLVHLPLRRRDRAAEQWRLAKADRDETIRQIVALVPRDPEKEDIFQAIKRVVQQLKAVRDLRKEMISCPNCPPPACIMHYDRFGELYANILYPDDPQQGRPR